MLESIWTVGEQVLILFILSGVGFVLGKVKMIGDKFSRDACQLVMYVVSPCMMVVAFQRSFEKDVFHNFCMALLLSLLIHLLSITVAQLFLRKKTERAAALRFSVVHSNCGYMGYPLQTALLGTIGIFYGSAYVTAFTVCSWTYGLMQMSGGRVKASAKTLLLNPGIISVVAHVAGKDLRKMVDAYFAGNVAEAQEINMKLYDIFKTMFITSNPVPVKYALNRIGINVGGVRLPLFEANDAEKAKIDASLSNLGLL